MKGRPLPTYFVAPRKDLLVHNLPGVSHPLEASAETTAAVPVEEAESQTAVAVVEDILVDGILVAVAEDNHVVVAGGNLVAVDILDAAVPSTDFAAFAEETRNRRVGPEELGRERG